MPAGDDHHDAGITGQQRAYLLCATRVVEHDHHPPVGEHGAVQASGPVHVDRHLVRRHAESREKTGERLERHHRRRRGVAAQVHVQLAVREPVPHTVRPMNGQRGLADPRGAGDHHDGGRGGAAVGVDVHVRRQRVEPGQISRSAGERGDRRRKLCGGRDSRRTHAWYLARFGGRVDLPEVGRQRVAAGQHGLLHLAGQRARLDPELLDEAGPQCAERRERVRLPPRPVQRQHQLRPQPFAQRVFPHQNRQFGGEVTEAPQPQVEIDPPLQHDHATFVQPGRGTPAGVQRQVVQGRSAPQFECRPQREGGMLIGWPIRCRSGQRRGQLLEPIHVQLTRTDPQQIPRWPSHQPQPVRTGRQHPPQPRDTSVQQTPRRGRRILPPQVGHQPLPRHHPVGVQQQQREQPPLLRAAQRDWPAVREHLQRPQDPEPGDRLDDGHDGPPTGRTVPMRRSRLDRCGYHHHSRRSTPGRGVLLRCLTHDRGGDTINRFPALRPRRWRPPGPPR